MMPGDGRSDGYLFDERLLTGCPGTPRRQARDDPRRLRTATTLAIFLRGAAPSKLLRSNFLAMIYGGA